MQIENFDMERDIRRRATVMGLRFILADFDSPQEDTTRILNIVQDMVDRRVDVPTGLRMIADIAANQIEVRQRREEREGLMERDMRPVATNTVIQGAAVMPHDDWMPEFRRFLREETAGSPTGRQGLEQPQAIFVGDDYGRGERSISLVDLFRAMPRRAAEPAKPAEKQDVIREPKRKLDL
jgi:hypothetical protein